MTVCRKRLVPGSAIRVSADEAEAGETPIDSDQPKPTPIRFLRLDDVLKLTGLGKTKIYELQAEGLFPMRVQITAHSVGWVEQEVQAWLTSRITASSSLPARGSVSAAKQPPSR